ncbi:HAD family hydrolase [Rhodohalobacter sp. SW132]|uniref:D-glycero-alpha-D-manno-heptose-1,7-bisphosphate 7-phosphatase n=1 Tax=Rhodohalobacter sp. SW132 TaxID=2293433 RepID=UPI000E251E87|nr:HAD family hydrolase [Rhodohalobacter sp. SW132]REL38479.1 HAD family hydrolase [Rhodohalobacter sp. SW132]
MKQKAFFLDRDGTLNVDYNYVHTKEEWAWCDGALEALRIIQDQGFKIVVVTNQSGIARARYTEEDVIQLHKWVDEQLSEEGLSVDAWHMAPHHPEYDPKPHTWPSEDRKPDTGMFDKAAENLGLRFNGSFMAGDKISDLQPAIKLGMKPIFIRSRHEPKQDKAWLKKHSIRPYDTLLDAVKELL